MTRFVSHDRGSARAALLAAVLLAGGLTAALVPAQAAPTGPPAVQGGAVQAWQATKYRPAAPAAVTAVDYYFTGTPTDQVDKLTGDNPASFAKAKPTGTSDASQNAEGGTDDGTPTSPGTAYWSAAFTGALQARVTMHWWWQTLDPASAGLNAPALGVRVWADPGTPQQKLIGTNDVVMDAFGTGPSEETAVVDVKGTVAKKLLIQAISLNSDAGHGFRVFYGSATHPSRFSVPTGAAAAPVKVPSNPAVRDTAPLALSATPIGRKAAEPTIGITKKGNAFFAAADFDGLSPANPRTLIYASYDGNKTWKDVTPIVAGQTFPPATLDPYIYVDQETGRIFSDDLLVGCSLLQWSDDEGKTWSRGNPLACDMPVDDHQTIVAGNPPAGVTTNGYPNVIYYCVNKVAGAVCARSLDGGNTFLATGEPAFAGVQPQAPDGTQSSGPGVCGSLHGHIVTDPAGRLYLPKGHCANPWLAVSEDGGQTWRTTLVNKMAVAGTQTAVASDQAGNIYYLWWAADTKLPYMAVSRDAGKTFGPALLVGPPGLQSVNFPSIDAGKPGQVAISYPGTTDPAAAKPSRAWNYYVAVSTNALAEFPVFHSATANKVSDPIHRGVCVGRCAGMYDFLDVVIDPAGAVWATAVDTCTKGCSTAKGPNLSGAEEASDAQGIAVRQLSGPVSVVRAPAAAPPPAAAPGAAPSAPSGGSLPATGGGAGAALLGACLLLVAALSWRLRHPVGVRS
ncbi:MAG: hypothetical protein QOE05_3443 [Actinomycetota bacterium]|jgi:hypothetical protein|nr:hypothetical protein [Actinomycetota bacterium]